MIKYIMFGKCSAILAMSVAVALLFMPTACTREPREEVIPVTGVTLTPPSSLLLVGNTLTLEATIEPAEATNKTVTWRTDDDRVATVNAEGELTAVAPGTGTITVTTEGGRFTATCTVTVAEPTITMTTQDSYQYVAIFTSGTGDDIIIDWGDGKVSKFTDAIGNNGYGGFSFLHEYSSASEHHIIALKEKRHKNRGSGQSTNRPTEAKISIGKQVVHHRTQGR